MVHREGHVSVGAVNTRTAGVNQVFDVVAPTAFEYASKTDDVAVDVG